MEGSQTIRPEEAAVITGIPAGRIRNLLRRDYIKKTNDLPIGRAYPASSGKSFRYKIYKPMVAKCIGLDKWPEEGGTGQ